MRSCRLAPIFPVLTFLAVVGCGSSDGVSKDDCVNGICTSDPGNSTKGGTGGRKGSGGSTSPGGDPGKDGGGNGGSGSGGNASDDGGLSATGGNGGGTGTGGATGTGGGGSVQCASNGCTESWSCTPWQTSGAGSDAGTRTCTDANACGTQSCKPTESVTLPKLSLDNFKCNVEPVLNKFCAQLGCHGTEQGRALRVYARGRLRITGEMLLETGCLKPAGTMVPTERCIGSVECACWTAPHTPTEWQRNFDSARGFLIDSMGMALADVEDAELLQQPLVGGGFAHAGIHIFAKGDADYDAIKNWLGGATTSCTNGNLKN